MNAIQLIPPKVRLGVYLATFLIGLALTSISGYYTSLDLPIPDVIRGIAGGALPPITTAFAAVAASNTTKQMTANQAVVTAPDTVTVTSTATEVKATGEDGETGPSEDYDPSVPAYGYGSGVKQPHHP